MATCWQGQQILFAMILMVAIETSLTTSKVILPEKLVISDVLEKYPKWGRYGRSIERSNESIAVEFSLELHSIVNVDDSVQPTVTIFCWMSQQWKDPLLTWDPYENHGVTEVTVPLRRIWFPDTTLYNGLFTEQLVEEKIAVLQFNGAIAWISPRTFKVSCERMDEGEYPYDGLRCFFKFGSWTTPGTKIKYSFSSEDSDFGIATFNKHPSWRINGHFASKNELFYPCCPKTPFLDLSYHLKLRRIKHMPMFLIMFPLMLLGPLTALPFLMPDNTVAKVQTACMNFLAIFIYMVALFATIPHYIMNQWIVLCCHVEMIIAAISILLSSWLSDLTHRQSPVPVCLWKACDFIAAIFLCRFCIRGCHQCSAYTCKQWRQLFDVIRNKRQARRQPQSTDETDNISTTTQQSIPMSGLPNKGYHQETTTDDNIGDTIDYSSATLQSPQYRNSKHATIAQQWRTISRVLNFVLAFIFLTSNVVLIAFTYPKRGWLQELFSKNSY